jgi:hypothetical protein
VSVRTFVRSRMSPESHFVFADLDD